MKYLLILLVALSLSGCNPPFILRSTVQREHDAAERSLQRFVNMPDKERAQNQKSIDFLEGYLSALEIIQGQGDEPR